MKRYTITVNGQSYDVSVEEIGGQAVPAAAAAAPKPAAAAPAAPSPNASTAQTAPAAPSAEPPAPPASLPCAATVKAPMPGTVLSFNVAVGQAVKRGDVILILEAMKMENEIVAPVDGTVSALRVAPGSAVNTGEPLLDLA